VLPDAKAHLTWPEFLGAVASGILLFWLVSRFIHPICPACSTSAAENAARERLQKDAILLMAALAIHCTVDGLAVAAGDGQGGKADLPLLLALSVHKLPEGLALALLLIGAGYRKPVALGWTWAVEMTTELGGALGVWGLQSVSPVWLSLVFAHVGGGFLYLVGLTVSAFGRHAKIPSSLLDTPARKTL
jgi:ZIP family zinc transporter